jgi:hypothetical protein
MQLTHDIRKLTEISHLVMVVLSNEDALTLKGEYDKKVVSESHVEGFRKGKAPIHVIAAKVGREKYCDGIGQFDAYYTYDYRDQLVKEYYQQHDSSNSDAAPYRGL